MASYQIADVNHYRANTGNRVSAAIIAVLVQCALGYALIAGFGVDLTRKVSESLKTFIVTPPAPPPPIEPKTVPEPRQSRQREGAASAPNIVSKPAEVVAPKPFILTTIPPPPIVTATRAGMGSDPTQGSAPQPGPGSGSGGVGNGRGSGGHGPGGGSGGYRTPPRQIAGRIRNRDYPSDAAARGMEGTVSVEYFILPDGHPSECKITHSSGSASLDQTTCRLITERFRYRPSFDASGRAVRSIMVADHIWVLDDRDLQPG